ANIAERFREIAILTQHLDKAMSGEAAAVKERDALRGRLAGREKELGETVKERDALRGRLAGREKELGETVKERDALRGRLAGREKELGEARRSEQALSQKKTVLEADIADRFTELATLTKLLADRENELQRRAVQVEGFQTRVAEME